MFFSAKYRRCNVSSSMNGAYKKVVNESLGSYRKVYTFTVQRSATNYSYLNTYYYSTTIKGLRTNPSSE